MVHTVVSSSPATGRLFLAQRNALSHHRPRANSPARFQQAAACEGRAHFSSAASGVASTTQHQHEHYRKGANSSQQQRAQTTRSRSAVAESSSATTSPPDLRLLCISNGHGEDTIAAAILKEIQKVVDEEQVPLQICALPLVGKGDAYAQAGIPMAGPQEVMPSGGFITTDRSQIIRDLFAGLLSLTFRQWAAGGGGAILAVGDLVPLLLTGAAGPTVPYAFIGCAKSEYYAQNVHTGTDPRPLIEQILSPECVYFPWERAYLANPQCRLVAPRDDLTATALRTVLPTECHSKVEYLGNPMMDGLGVDVSLLRDYLPDDAVDGTRVVLLPGTRQPEVYANWDKILDALESVTCSLLKRDPNTTLVFLAPVPPSFSLVNFHERLEAKGWSFVKNAQAEEAEEPCFVREFSAIDNLPGNCAPCTIAPRLLLVHGCFAECLQIAHAAIAMAGTATEQVVGLGIPAFTFPGSGPQFTPEFARLQALLLGESVILCTAPNVVGLAMSKVLPDKEQLRRIRANGIARMGPPGSSRRLAEKVLDSLRLRPTDS